MDERSLNECVIKIKVNQRSEEVTNDIKRPDNHYTNLKKTNQGRYTRRRGIRRQPTGNDFDNYIQRKTKSQKREIKRSTNTDLQKA